MDQLDLRGIDAFGMSGHLRLEGGALLHSRLASCCSSNSTFVPGEY